MTMHMPPTSVSATHLWLDTQEGLLCPKRLSQMAAGRFLVLANGRPAVCQARPSE